ncbi:MAG: hypothetical protein ACHQAV_06250 [Solirubrobacterales bacterium]
MHTFFGKLAAAPRITRRRRRHAGAEGPQGSPARPPRRTLAEPEGGFMLIEVIISALLVATIVIATLTGFDVVNRTTADQRQHDQAIVLASQSQEQLRSDPSSTLQTLESSPHSYTAVVSGTTYTITQQAQLLPAGEYSASCAVNETKRQSTNAFKITSKVTWPQQTATKRLPVYESSIITPPVGSGLEVDAGNSPTPTEGVSGITALVKYIPAGGGSTVTLERTTGSEGCVIFGGIPATSATVEIKEILGFVTRNGSTTYPPKEVLIAPNITTHYQVTYNRGGAIKARFAYNNSTSNYKHANNEGTGEVEEPIISDTFVAANNRMNAAPNYELGSTRGNTGALYEPLPGKTGTYEASAVSPRDSARYPTGNLFPFIAVEKGYWTVYAGDCPQNQPETVTGNVVKAEENSLVTPGGLTEVKVPMSYVALNLYKFSETKVNGLAASERWKDLETTTSYPVTITNTKCSGSTPNNESAVNDQHTQETTTETTKPKYGGHLEDPFQPFGTEFTLCLLDSSLERTYKVKYENKALIGGSVSIYLPQRPTGEVVKEREEKESAYKAKEAAYKAKEAAYKTKETAYKTKETEYKAKETAYKNKEAEYKAKKTEKLKKEYETLKKEYETLKKEYETLKKEYETLKGEYETLKGEYVTDKSEYETDKTEYLTDKTEYETLKKEYEKLKGEYEATKAEEKEGALVTVEKGTVC